MLQQSLESLLPVNNPLHELIKKNTVSFCCVKGLMCCVTYIYIYIGGMSQLPTYILLEKGVEDSRFSDFYVDAAPSLPITKVTCFFTYIEPGFRKL